MLARMRDVFAFDRTTHFVIAGIASAAVALVPDVTHGTVDANVHAHHDGQWQADVDDQVQVVAVNL